MVRWAYIPLVLFGSVTYNIRIWFRIPRSKVLHCWLRHWFADKHFLHVKSLRTKGQDKKKRKRENTFFVCCLRLCLWKLTSVLLVSESEVKQIGFVPIIYEPQKLLLDFYINCCTGDETQHLLIPLSEINSSDSVCMSGIRFIVSRLVQTGPGSPPVCCQIGTSWVWR